MLFIELKNVLIKIKAIVLIYFLLFSFVNADWVYHSSTNSGTWHFEDRQIAVRDNDVWVWLRKKYDQPAENGDRSLEGHYKINCQESSFQRMSHTTYSDENWSILTNSSQNPSQKLSIPPGSTIEEIANKLCKK